MSKQPSDNPPQPAKSRRMEVLPDILHSRFRIVANQLSGPGTPSDAILFLSMLPSAVDYASFQQHPDLGVFEFQTLVAKMNPRWDVNTAVRAGIGSDRWIIGGQEGFTDFLTHVFNLAKEGVVKLGLEFVINFELVEDNSGRYADYVRDENYHKLQQARL